MIPLTVALVQFDVDQERLTFVFIGTVIVPLVPFAVNELIAHEAAWITVIYTDEDFCDPSEPIAVST